jgi:hypothetical protein
LLWNQQLTISTGLPVQPLERTILALLLRTLRHHNFPLVGFVVGFDLHQPTGYALSRIRVLRLLVHNLDPRSTAGRTSLLLNTIQSGPGYIAGHFRDLVDRHDLDCCRSETSGRGRLGRNR